VRRRRPELLGFHGIVLSSTEPGPLARRWRELTGLPLLRRGRDEIVLGAPELFVVVRRKASGADTLEEAHLAVEELSATGRRGAPDALGGDSWSRDAGESTLVVREFRRPPSPRWRRRRS
jgi:hypothetical protein